MILEDVMEILEETGYPIAYHHFEEGQEPELPYIVYLSPQTENVMADGKTYIKIDELNVELYTEEKDLKAERRLEDVLEVHGLSWQKTEAYLETEKMYEVLYEMEV